MKYNQQQEKERLEKIAQLTQMTESQNETIGQQDQIPVGENTSQLREEGKKEQTQTPLIKSSAVSEVHKDEKGSFVYEYYDEEDDRDNRI